MKEVGYIGAVFNAHSKFYTCVENNSFGYKVGFAKILPNLTPVWPILNVLLKNAVFIRYTEF